MFSAWLVGAGLAGLLDAGLSAEFAGPLRREALLVVLAADLGLAALVAALFFGARAKLSATGALVAGFAVGSVPPLVSWLDASVLAGGLAALLASGGVAVGGRLRVSPRAVRMLSIALVCVYGVAAARSSSLDPRLPARAVAAADGRPDLVLVSVDTLRADVPAACMPNLAALASTGVRSAYALAPSSLTLPSHVTMLSGLPLEDHGVFDNQSVVPPVPWLAEQLRDAGYRTAAVVSNYLVRAEAGFGRGVEVYDEAPVVQAGPVQRFRASVRRATWWGWIFGALPRALDRWLFGDAFDADPNRGNAQRTTDHALRLVRQLTAQPAPYWLFVHYMDPHDPYVPPGDAHCEGAQAVPPAASPARADWRALRRIARDLREGRPGAEGARAGVRALYDREARAVDLALGRLFAELRRGPRPVVLLVTADHGEHFGDHALMTHGESVYEAGLRVPFVLAGPGIPERVLEHPPQLVDVVPTLLSLAGLEPGPLPGLDLSRSEPGPRSMFARAGPHASLRDPQGYKLLLEFDGRARPGRLYSLASDPGENVDLRTAEPVRFEQLDRALRARARRSAAAPRERTADHLKALRALGYVE